MPLDTSIINPSAGVLQSIANPAPLPSLADIQAKQLALQNARLQSQSSALDVQQKQKEIAEHQQVVQALHDSGGDVDKAVDTLFAQGNSQAPVLAKNRAEMQKAVEEHKKNVLDNLTHQAGLVGNAANAVITAPDEIKPIVYQGQKKFLESNNLLPQGVQLPDQYTPDMLPQLQGMVVRSQSVKDQADTVRANTEADKAKNEIAAKQRANAVNILSTATDDPGYQKGITDLEARGVPASVLKEFKGQTWTPQLGAQLTRMSVSPDKRIEIPVQQTAAIQAQADQANEPLTVAAGLGGDAFKTAVQQQPQTVQDRLKGLGPNPTAAQVHRALLSPKEQDTYDNLQSEEKSRQVANTIAQGHLDVARQDLRLKQMYAPPAGTTGAANLTGEDFLKTLPPSQANLLRQMGNGDIPPPPPGSRSQIAQQQLQALTQYDPTFNSNRFNTMKDFSTGSAHKSVNAVNTAITHLELLQQAGHAMHNGSFVPGNAIYNAFTNEFGSPEPSNFDNIMQRVSGELNKATGSNGEKEMEAIKNNLNRSGSNSQIDGAVKTNIQLLGGAMDSNKQDYMRGTGFSEDHPKVQALLSPRAKQALANIGFDPNMKPLPKAAAVDVQAARQQYKHVATMPNGDLIGSNDGKTWSDVKSGKKVQ